MSPEEREKREAEAERKIRAAFAKVAEESGCSVDEVWKAWVGGRTGKPVYIRHASLKQSKN